MRRRLYRYRFLLLSLLLLSSLHLVVPSQAEACSICNFYFILGFAPYRATKENEVGSTGCTNYYDPFAGFYCEESGDFCSTISVVGGGGGGTGGGGGGGDACASTRFCPAECFSCEGGGGRPPAN